MSLILKSIEEEAIDCRVAWKGFDIGTFALHCHHETLAEPLREDAENRIAYILSSKPKFEQALRLRLFRPVSEKSLAKQQKAYAECNKADARWNKAYANLAVLVHTAVCKNCPWNGKTIFPKENQ